MDLVECIEGRVSVRGFTSEGVPPELVTEAIRIGNLAPSAGNLQARDFVIVTDPGTRRSLAQAANQHYVEEAPVVIVCCANLQRISSYGHRGKELYCLQDVAAAIENMLLFFVEKGYGSCWIGAFDEKAVSRALSIPSHVRPVAMLPIGRPKAEGGKRPRMDPRQLMHYERW
ncbi:MAG: nitroreductase family protein [Methanomassiliicoccales archaeon]|nr:nitroreductase family protein [Methanomassiliicoccales archaeon]